MNNKAIEILKRFEGFRKEAYKCAGGVATLGYGSTFYLDGSPVQMGDTITEKDAEILLIKVVDDFKVNVKRLLPYTLPEDAVDAVVIMVYNIGLGAFTKSTLLKRIKEDHLNFAAIETEWNKWVYAGKKVLPGLVKRRKEEFALYKSAVLAQYTKVECYELGRASK